MLTCAEHPNPFASRTKPPPEIPVDPSRQFALDLRGFVRGGNAIRIEQTPLIANAQSVFEIGYHVSLAENLENALLPPSPTTENRRVDADITCNDIMSVTAAEFAAMVSRRKQVVEIVLAWVAAK